jgi:hypothetical protein
MVCLCSVICLDGGAVAQVQGQRQPGGLPGQHTPPHTRYSIRVSTQQGLKLEPNPKTGYFAHCRPIRLKRLSGYCLFSFEELTISCWH